MSTPDRCQTVQARLSDALLGRDEAAVGDRQHSEHCEACGSHRRALARLATDLGADVPIEASDALVHVTLERARAEFARREAARAAPIAGWPREVGRLVGAALLPLPLVLLWNAAVLSFGAELLTGLLPDGLLWALGAGYVMAAVTWLACLYGSLPVLAHGHLVAHEQLRRRAPEVST